MSRPHRISNRTAAFPSRIFRLHTPAKGLHVPFRAGVPEMRRTVTLCFSESFERLSETCRTPASKLGGAPLEYRTRPALERREQQEREEFTGPGDALGPLTSTSNKMRRQGSDSLRAAGRADRPGNQVHAVQERGHGRFPVVECPAFGPRMRLLPRCRLRLHR